MKPFVAVRHVSLGKRRAGPLLFAVRAAIAMARALFHALAMPHDHGDIAVMPGRQILAQRLAHRLQLARDLFMRSDHLDLDGSSLMTNRDMKRAHRLRVQPDHRALDPALKLHIDALAQYARQLGSQAHGRGLRRIRTSGRARYVNGRTDRTDRTVLRPRRTGRRLVGGRLTGHLRQGLLIARRARGRLPDTGRRCRAGGRHRIAHASARTASLVAEPFAVAQRVFIGQPFAIARRRDAQRLTRLDHRTLSKRESAEPISQRTNCPTHRHCICRGRRNALTRGILAVSRRIVRGLHIPNGRLNLERRDHPGECAGLRNVLQTIRLRRRFGALRPGLVVRCAGRPSTHRASAEQHGASRTGAPARIGRRSRHRGDRVHCPPSAIVA
ncbi:hypothetical protein DP44_2726 [Burkholderia pseudomallei]|nr:hypothetical protein DP44_2726 [Burkholderia pseudomallei]KGD48182.1 hypothetical protein DP43_1938 [Burkholderia pseudomallei]